MTLQLFKLSLKRLFPIAMICVTSSCSVEPPDAFEPEFSGMPKGEFTRHNCLHINDFSLWKKERGVESKLNVYKGEACRGSTLHKVKLTRDIRLAGVWNHYLVLTHGTGLEKREIELIDLSGANKDFRVLYVLDPKFSDQSLSFYKPTEEIVSPDKCKGAEEEAQTWAQAGLDIGIATKMTFRSGTAGATVEPETACYPYSKASIGD